MWHPNTSCNNVTATLLSAPPQSAPTFARVDVEVRQKRQRVRPQAAWGPRQVHHGRGGRVHLAERQSLLVRPVSGRHARPRGLVHGQFEMEQVHHGVGSIGQNVLRMTERVWACRRIDWRTCRLQSGPMDTRANRRGTHTSNVGCARESGNGSQTFELMAPAAGLFFKCFFSFHPLRAFLFLGVCFFIFVWFIFHSDAKSSNGRSVRLIFINNKDDRDNPGENRLILEDHTSLRPTAYLWQGGVGGYLSFND